MEHIIVGLGNPGAEYEHTRHNVGRMVVLHMAKSIGATEWRDDHTLRAKVAQRTLMGKEKIMLVLPDNYMNRSGGAVAPLVKGAKGAERLIVVHDDIDLPLGTLRIVFDRGSGGHNGVLSIERALKTREFVRVRVGVLPVTPGGTVKKPSGANAVHDFILRQLTKKECETIDSVVVRASEAVQMIIARGRESAMREYN